MRCVGLKNYGPQDPENFFACKVGDGDDFKGLCTVHRSPVGAVRQGASIDLRIFISSDWRSMGVTPGLDT